MRERESVGVAELAAQLGVSVSTVRRDLRTLSQGEQPMRGGSVAVAKPPAPAVPICSEIGDHPYAEAARLHAHAKDDVGRRAAALVRDGDVVVIDIGTTAAAVADHLSGRRLTVITASLAVVDALRDDHDIELVVLGGVLRRPYRSLVGCFTVDALSRVRADRAFIGTSGVARDGSVLDTTLAEVSSKRAIIASAASTTLVADAAKFPGEGTLRICGVEELDMLVTNDGADPDTLLTCLRGGVEVLTA